MRSLSPSYFSMAACVLALLFLGELKGEYVFTELAALGDAFPQGNGGEFEFDFEPSCVNNSGEVAFGADLCVPGAQGVCQGIGEGVFLMDSQGAIQLVARAGDAPPGGGLLGRSFVGLIALNELGDLAFAFELQGGDQGLYAFYDGVGLRNLVRPGQASPCGANFAGAFSHPAINNHREVVFGAVCNGCDVDPLNLPGINGQAVGVFLADEHGNISSVVCPGDPAPGGSVFDCALHPWNNDWGEVAFGAHVAGDACWGVGNQLVCAESVYLKRASGDIVSVAHQGDPSPCGDPFRLAFGPILNNRGQVVFVGDLTPAPMDIGKRLGIFLWEDGQVQAVACPGDPGNPGTPVPGGGNMETGSFFVGACSLNNLGDVVFTATLDVQCLDIDGDGTLEPDQGLFVWSKGTLRLVARTCTVLKTPDGGQLGTLAALLPPDVLPSFPDNFPWPWWGTDINDRGQVLFTAALTDGRGVLLLATPEDEVSEPLFVRGFCNDDDRMDISDAVFLLNHLFAGGPAPTCREACNFNADDRLDISDAVFLLNHLFGGGPGIPPPVACEAWAGVDCEAFAGCP